MTIPPARVQQGQTFWPRGSDGETCYLAPAHELLQWYLVDSAYDRLVAERAGGVSEVTLGPNTSYRCTKRLRECASDILSILLSEAAADGIQLSYTQLQRRLANRYGKTFIAVACQLLIRIDLLDPPQQRASTDRRLIWHIPPQVRETLCAISQALPQSYPGGDNVSWVDGNSPRRRSFAPCQVRDRSGDKRSNGSLVPRPTGSTAQRWTKDSASDMPSLMQANEGGERPPQNQLHVYGSSSQNNEVLKAAVHHQHVQPTPYICDMDVLFTRRPDNMHASSESESLSVEGITKQEQDSDSLDPAVVRLFYSMTWSPQVVEAIISAMGLMPEKLWQRRRVAEQCSLVYEQVKHLPPEEACRQLIITLEYMQTTQPFWKERYERGLPIVLSLGGNFERTHHHFLEMYRELTARGWRSKLEEQWLMERLAEQAEEQACMRAALEVCKRDGIPADGLCDEDLLAIGRQCKKPDCDSGQYERGEREQASARNTHLGQPAPPPAFPSVPPPRLPGTDSESRTEAPPEERKPVHGMSEAALFDLAERIAAECPALAPCLFAGRAEDGGATIRIVCPGLTSVRVLSCPADWLEQELFATDEYWAPRLNTVEERAAIATEGDRPRVYKIRHSVSSSQLLAGGANNEPSSAALLTAGTASRDQSSESSAHTSYRHLCPMWESVPSSLWTKRFHATDKGGINAMENQQRRHQFDWVWVKGNRKRCRVCQWSWPTRRQSACPGVPRYAYEAWPPTLHPAGELIRLGREIPLTADGCAYQLLEPHWLWLYYDDREITPFNYSPPKTFRARTPSRVVCKEEPLQGGVFKTIIQA